MSGGMGTWVYGHMGVWKNVILLQMSVSMTGTAVTRAPVWTCKGSASHDDSASAMLVTMAASVIEVCTVVMDVLCM